MSPRTDSYLSLCLEQANKSTLHYRHGCIIVRGGKVIGQGYNDYRPGFNGGRALKTGRFATGASGRPAIMALKQKNKSKNKRGDELFKPLCRDSTMLQSDEVGGGCPANSPLSMHSEMAAIQSALSLCGNAAARGSARSSQLMQKPGSYKLPGRGKRPLRLRQLKAYVNAVCDEASVPGAAAKRPPSRSAIGAAYSGKAQIHESRPEPSPSQLRQGEGAGSQGQGGE